MAPLTEEDFTFRQLQIMYLIKHGYSNKDIALVFKRSEHTIKRHREEIALKAGTKGKLEFRRFILNFQIIKLKMELSPILAK